MWLCPECGNELGGYNAYCEYCKQSHNKIIYNPDPYYIREIRISHIVERSDATMTPQEELFAKLFNHEALLVKDMDTLTLRAHREELAKIAFEARARISAVDEEEKQRKKLAAGNGKATGFSRSVNTDETATNAINTIKERQKKLSKADKIKAGLLAMGVSEADAEKMMSAGNILAKLKDKDSKDKIDKEIITGETLRSPLGSQAGFILKKPEVREPEKPKTSFNPFEKK